MGGDGYFLLVYRVVGAVASLTPKQIEGGASILIGIVAFFALPSFPDKAKWLKPEEKSYLLDKLQKDRGDSDTEPVTLKVIQSTLMDWTLWLHAVVFCFNVSSAYALAFFGPTILVVGQSVSRIWQINLCVHLRILIFL